MIQNSIFKIRHSSKRGFTLVELAVTLGIFAVMTGVVLARYRTFDTNAKFANATEDIVLALRQAQVYGVGTKGQSSSFATPYGVHFDMAFTNRIKLFADNNLDYIYNAGDTEVETIQWGNGIVLSSVECDTGACGGSKLSAVFKRPNPDAIISNSTVSGYSVGKISITNGPKTSIIVITKAGQISIQ